MSDISEDDGGQHSPIKLFFAFFHHKNLNWFYFQNHDGFISFEEFVGESERRRREVRSGVSCI